MDNKKTPASSVVFYIIGIILLIGIVKKNAIMMIDFALDAERQQAMTPFDAIRQACLLRFRPILMTTLAALFGALPLHFSGCFPSFTDAVACSASYSA